MNIRRITLKITTAALLTAVGILIPMFMPPPLKFVIEPMSFTFASHVAVMLAMFLAPDIAAAVAAGTTVGFFLSGLPLMVGLRAASQIIFVMLGAFYIQRRPAVLGDTWKMRLFSLILGVIHAAAEVAVVTFFYFSGKVAGSFVYSVLLLVGIGTLVHSMVDFEIAYWITKAFRGPARLRRMVCGERKEKS